MPAFCCFHYEMKIDVSNFFQRQAKPLIIAGPCSAESQIQVETTAEKLAAMGIRFFRAGTWKPRTRPNHFEGVGETALQWLAAIQQKYDMAVFTEVANAKHVAAVLAAGLTGCWIGARTTVSPFAVQEIAEALRGTQLPVLVKNPINPDLGLWLGAFERLMQAGVTNLAACHRGFSFYGAQSYRNPPCWEIPLEFRRQAPELTLICDPSHIAGRRELVASPAQQALHLGFDGLMIETHISPQTAQSDAAQQLTPAQLGLLLSQLEYPKPDSPDTEYNQKIAAFRSLIDETDRAILEVVARRMDLARKIGWLKQEKGVQFFQPERYATLLDTKKDLARHFQLSPDFIERLFQLLHTGAIEQQTAIGSLVD